MAAFAAASPAMWGVEAVPPGARHSPSAASAAPPVSAAGSAAPPRAVGVAAAAAALSVAGGRRRARGARTARRAVNLQISTPRTYEQCIPAEIRNSKYSKELEVCIKTMTKSMWYVEHCSKLFQENKDESAVGFHGFDIEKLYSRVIGEDARGEEMTFTVADAGLMALWGRVLREEFPDDQVMCEDNALFASGDEELATATAEQLQKAHIFDDAIVTHVDVANWNTHCGSYIEKTGDSTPPNRYWVLLPLDTTREWRLERQCCTSICLMEDGKPVLSVVGGPNSPFDHPTRLEESKDGSPIFFAVEGAGSWTQMVLLGKSGLQVNERQGLQIVEAQMRGRALKMEASEKIKRGNDGLYDVLGTEQIVFAQNHHLRQDIFQDGRNLAKMLGSEYPKMNWSDSSIKYCWLARGELDALWYFPQGLYNNDVLERATHHAAGSLIAKEAGAGISDLEGKELVWCGPVLKENRGALAIDPKKLDIDGVVSAVMEATGDSDAAYAYRCDKRKEHSQFMIDLSKEISKTINEEGSEQEKKMWNKAKKGMKGYLEDDKAMDKMAQRAINAEKPLFGQRAVQPGEDAFR